VDAQVGIDISVVLNHVFRVLTYAVKTVTDYSTSRPPVEKLKQEQTTMITKLIFDCNDNNAFMYLICLLIPDV
jgi:hypothetical protein